MISLQNVIGVGATAALFAGVFNALGLVTETPAYIEVHSLEYSAESGQPMITQNRTVGGNGPVLVAKWEAKAFLIRGTTLEEVCSGGAGADYTGGFKAHIMPFDIWVGEQGCFDSLPDGATVRLFARHTWGEGEFKEKWSERFVVDKSVLLRPVQ